MVVKNFLSLRGSNRGNIFSSRGKTRIGDSLGGNRFLLFITHNANSAAAQKYFDGQLVRSDYYMREQEIAGHWHGLGAAALGLAGPVQREHYFRLCDNQNPFTGQRLTARTNARRRCTYEFEFDAPKSVSLAYEVGGDERILDAMRMSVQETMAEIETAACVRVRKGGQFANRVTGNMVWAEFVHRTTRPLEDGVPDPQLHVHAVAQNLSYDVLEECWKAGEFGDIKRRAQYYQSGFHARLADRLRGLGYGIERDGKSFRLVGIDRSLTERFSRRTQVIETEAERLHITDAKQKSALGRKTRKGKGREAAISQLRANWRARLTLDEIAAIRRAAGRAADGNQVTPQAAMEHSLEHTFERASVATEDHLLSEALMHGVGSVSVASVHRELNRGDVIRKQSGDVQYATTKAVLDEERKMLAFARSGRGQHRKLGGAKPQLADSNLSSDQRQAALTILRSRGTVTALNGGAGTGKTRMMQDTVKAIEKTGLRVFTFAPSAEASRGVLRAEGFANADTVERLLTDTRLQEQLHGQVIWIDEAGLMSVRETKRVFDLAEKGKNRVILSGDANQHTSVIRGDAFRLLEQKSGITFARLTEIRRQTDTTYRAAVKALSEGAKPSKNGGTRFTEGVSMLDGMGAVVEVGGENRYRQLARDYVAVTSALQRGEPKTALVVSPTHREGEKVTACIRHELKLHGRLKGSERSILSLASRNLTEAQRRTGSSYQIGDVIQFHQNAKGFKRGKRVTVASVSGGAVGINRSDQSSVLPLHEAAKFQVYSPGTLALAAGDRLRITQNGFTQESRRGILASKDRLNNGAVYQVEGFTRTGDIRLTNGLVVPHDYGGLTHGYAVTSHASQGRTVDTVLIALGSESLSAANRELLYVAASRGRYAVRLYTDDKRAMIDAVQSTARRLSALELVNENGHSQRAGILNRVALRQRVRDNYAAIKQFAREATKWTQRVGRKNHEITR